jgi:hypothetical protein
MPTQQWINQFTLGFHRQALTRMREKPQLLQQALKTLDRWESQGAQTGSQIYRDEWRQLIYAGVAAIERQVCNESEHATTLRSVSPLGFVLSPQERMQIRKSVEIH